MSEEEGIQDLSPEETTETEETSQGGVNYHDRIRVEPDFAVGEIQKKDRYIGELHEKAKGYKPLEPYLQAVGGDELARLAGIGNQIETNPHLKQALQDALNGVQKPVQEEEEEEIYDPEIKALRGRYDPRMEALENENRELQNRLNKTETISLKSSLDENVGKALSMFVDDDDLRGEALGELSKGLSQLETAAKNGDRSAAAQYQQLASPQGIRTLKMFTQEIYERYVAKKLELASIRPNGEVMLSKATDSQSKTRAIPPADTIAIKSGAKVTSQLVAEVMEKAARKLGKDPNVLFH